MWWFKSSPIETEEVPKIAIFTRMEYPHPISKERLDVHKRFYLESLKSQIYKNFDVYIITGGRKGESTPENINLLQKMKPEGINIFYKHFSDVPLHQYNIQIRVDDDDFLASTFILKCVDIYNKVDRDTFVISFIPYKYDYKNNKIYRVKPGKYSRKTTSMFSALCQKKEIKHFIYDIRHTRLRQITRNLITVEEGYCILIVHSDNIYSKIRENDIYFCNI